MMGRHRRRVGRGEVRWLILDVLKEQARHGYEVIAAVQERTQGAYRPSPGTVYPTLQMLEDTGHVTGDKKDGKRVFSLTEAGLEHLADNRDLVDEAWDNLCEDAHWHHRDELHRLLRRVPRLMRTVGKAFRRGGLSKKQTERIGELLDETIERVDEILKSKGD